MKLDKETREAIVEAVKAAQMEMAEVYEEKYVTAQELSEHISMFGKEWMSRNGNRLPRERVQSADAHLPV